MYKRIWGANNINNVLPLYSSWRDMFLQRPRLNFDGVYISKASYARAGEQSLDVIIMIYLIYFYYNFNRRLIQIEFLPSMAFG